MAHFFYVRYLNKKINASLTESMQQRSYLQLLRHYDDSVTRI